MQREKQNYKRFSITMPAELYDELEQMTADRGMDNRSLVIADLVKREVIKYRQQDRTRVMAGTLTIAYDATAGDCANRLMAIRRDYLDEVISTFQVMLEDGKNLEIWLVQGEVDRLYTLLSIALKCGKNTTGQITFADAILPPLRTNRNT